MDSSLAQQLRVVPGKFIVEHLPMGRPPADDEWYALVRAPEGLTVVRKEPPTRESSPEGVPAQESWVALYGESAHGLDLPGMLNALIGPLADASVPVFVTSTFHSDLVLIPHQRRSDAYAALRAAGHEVNDIV